MTYDMATAKVCGWLVHDTEARWNFSLVIYGWNVQDPDYDPNLLSDVESYVREALDYAATESPYSLAGKASGSLSREELDSIDWLKVYELVSEPDV